ncbi:hypothetical protein MTO96_051627, partial [Rhipicephalus appendiculatus]
VKPKRRRARGTTPWINEEASSFGNFLRTFSACALSTAGYRYAKKFSYPTQHFIHCALLNGFSSTWSAVSQREFSVRQCLHSCLAAAGCPDASRNLPFRLCSKSTVLLRQPLSPGTNK